MKLWEVLRDLEENPDMTYSNHEAWNEVTLGMGSVVSIGGVSVSRFDDWQEVKQPVTWQEAIQAWVDGKKVSYKYPQDHTAYSFQDSNRMMCIEKIKNAIWYIED